jgi:very-short-patch-repair endonuclease
MAARELLDFGLSRRAITEAVRSEEIVRVRQGWYSTPWLPPALQRAARVGGQLACASAAAHWKFWHLEDDRLHVVVDRNACQLRSAASYRNRLVESPDPGVVVHWTGRAEWPSRVLVPPEVCVDQVARCCSPEAALVIVESALNMRAVSAAAWTNVLSALPRERQIPLLQATALSGSGTETLFVHRLRQIGIPVRQQVRFSGVGYVDCLIGERLVVELDSVAHHSDPTTDRRRDAQLSGLGCRVLRFMHSQVQHRWPEVERAVLAAISRGDHRPA